jgi:two-component system, sensor histidine kinase and response regulator
MAEPGSPETVVVIDDDFAIRLSCSKILAKMGLPVETFEDGARGLEAIASLKPGLALVDLKMPGISGMNVVSRVHELDPQITVVVITGYATIDTAVEAMKAGAYDFLPKPFSPDELRIIVNRGLDRRRLALESQRAEVERELLKRRFVTFISHQLRAPLAAAQQMLEVLKTLEGAPEAEAKRRDWLERCARRMAELQGLIGNWLTLSRIEGGGLARDRVTVDLNPVIAALIENYRPPAAAEEISLESSLPEGELPVRGDRDCVSILFDNLITNAIKYNRRGGRVEVTGGETDGEIVIAVTDTGVGIPERCVPLLFGEFFRAGQDCGKRTPGSGLGLHISRRIALEMGGAIEVESREGAGSTFRVRLPAWRPSPVAAEEGGSA